MRTDCTLKRKECKTFYCIAIQIHRSKLRYGSLCKNFLFIFMKVKVFYDIKSKGISCAKMSSFSHLWNESCHRVNPRNFFSSQSSFRKQSRFLDASRCEKLLGTINGMSRSASHVANWHLTLRITWRETITRNLYFEYHYSETWPWFICRLADCPGSVCENSVRESGGANTTCRCERDPRFGPSTPKRLNFPSRGVFSIVTAM